MKILEFVPTVPQFFPETRRVIQEPLFSHRSDTFGQLHRETLALLGELAGNSDFQPVIAAGTGTYANDLLVWSYAGPARQPLVLVNGEFGKRLADQCCCCRSDTQVLDFGWGTPFTQDLLERQFREHPEIDLVLAAANETSTGMKNDLALVARYRRSLVLDGVSAVGVQQEFFQIPEVLAVSASSGKALAALPGIAICFLRRDKLPKSTPLPYSLNLPAILAAQQSPGGVRNTLGSTQLATLQTGCRALLTQGSVEYSRRLGELKIQLTMGLAELGIGSWAGSDSPLITTFFRPANWHHLLRQLESDGFGIYHQTAYLEQRKLFQIATLGNFQAEQIDRLLGSFRQVS